MLTKVLSVFVRVTASLQLILTTKVSSSAPLNTQQNNNDLPANDMISRDKTIREIFRKPRSHWVGDGFNVFPLFSDKAFTEELSPFLMFDYAAPREFPPTSQHRGVGRHPHRGFETVTIAFQGEVEHADSEGNRDVIGPGDVQWMTAARGIVHEEFHSTNFAKKGGTFEMCQLWVNLPKDKKMTSPKYQAIVDKNIPKVGLLLVDQDLGKCSPATMDDGYARIIAGEFRGVKGPAETFTPINMWEVVFLKSSSKYQFELPEGHTILVFVRRGSIEVQGEKLRLADVARMNEGGEKLTIGVTEKDTSVLILSGEPINEPIAARGPFVMNTDDELMQANRDYSSGSNGF